MRKSEGNKMLGRGLAWATLLGLGTLVQGCAIVHYYGPEKGLVVEKGTEKPIEGAAVVRVFKKTTSALIDTVNTDVTAQETVTGADGWYRFPGRLVMTMSYFFSWFKDETDVYLFKPGYGTISSPWADLSRMPDGSWKFELARVENVMDRRQNQDGFRLYDLPKDAFPYLLKLYNEESIALGLQPILEDVP